MRKLFTLRKLLFPFILFVSVFPNIVIGQVLAWDFFGENTGVATSTADVYNANLDASALLTRGSGASPSTANNSFRTVGFQNNGISTANTDYFQFTLSAAEGFKLSLSTIDARFAGTSTFAASPGVSSQFAYSLDGTSFILIGSPSVTIGTPVTLPQIDLSGISSLQNLSASTTVTFRYYASGQTSTGGWGFFSSAIGIYGLAVGGTINPVSGGATVDLSVSSNSASEAAATAITVTATASHPVTSNETVTLGVSGTGITTTDFTLSSTTITIPAGGTTGTATFTIIDDTEVEGTEIATLTISNPTAGIVLGTATQNVTIADNDIMVVPPPAIKINEVYGGGGNSGAFYKNDFIELYNPTASAVNLSGWSVQYTSATGTSWQMTPLSGSIPANGYYLIQQAAGTGGTTNLPTADATGTISMGAAAGKVALVNNTSALTVACPSGVIDFVGYGTTANCFEGSAAAPVPSATNSIQRSPLGFDSDNNNTDFVLLNPPTPKNSVTDIIAPVLISAFPADNATGVMTSFTATITFDENIQKGTGFITLKKADGTSVKIIDVTSSGVTVSGASVSFHINSLLFNTGYYFEISAGAFKDDSDNSFAGISGNLAWNFTTATTPPAGIMGTTYNFNTCSNPNLPNGFTYYNVAGAQVWGCTTFGRDATNLPSGSAPNGLQINGFASGINNINEDWLISPSYDLSTTAYPLLSFWSRTAFTGATLQLKVSTNYTGTGDPSLATWTDLNGKFPAQVSDIWKLSENINLTEHKSANTYFAFVYTSSSEDGARWTLDDITVTNSESAPPPSLTVSATDIQYTFVAFGSASDKTFTFIGNDLTGDVTLSSTGAFTLSKDGTTFASSMTYTLTEANNATKTVYVRFTPSQNNQAFSGAITVSTPGVPNAVINLNGSSIDPATTLEVVNWNIEWFGSPANGPTNDAQQLQNVKTIMDNIGADIYGVTEIVNEASLATLVSQLGNTPGEYSYKISNFGSHTNTCVNSTSALATAQKLAFIYKTSIFSNVTTTALLSAGINSCDDASSTSYNNWASGRYPFMMSADVTLNCETKNIKFILVHAKANTNPTTTSYNRRKAGADELHALLETDAFASENLVILGDFNDDLDESITAGHTTTSWNAFTTDASDFPALTLPLSLAGKKSTVSYNDVIDHVIISNELEPHYIDGSANILTDVTSLVTKYGSTTSDHYPVFTRYIFSNTTAPTVTSCPTVPGYCGTGNYTIPSFTASDDCGDDLTYSYVISGATSRSGNTNNASGNFNAGTSIITWTAADTWGNSVTCSTTVSIQQSYSYYADADNDGYGYGEALISCAATPPPGYSSNNYDCDDNDNGKKRIIVCHNGRPICIDEKALQAHLKHGDQLGSCTPVTTSARTSSNNFSASPVKTDVSAAGDLTLSNYPNPFTGSTVISYNVPADSKVSLKIYNGLGQAVSTLFEGDKKAGAYTIHFDGSALTNGFYYCKLIALSNKQQFVRSIKLSVAK